MNKISILIKILLNSKIIFSSPERKDIILYDKTGSDQFKSVLKGKKFFILADRKHEINKIYISLKIFFLMLLNIKANFFTSYLISLIKIIKPRIVLTFTDNSYKFSELAKSFKNNNNIKFIAVQNAYRLDLIEHDYLYKKKFHKLNLNDKLYLPYLFCLGQFDKLLYKRLKIKVKKIFKLGSLRMANSIEYLRKKKLNYNIKKFDICLVSDTTWSAHFSKKKNNDIPESKNIKYSFLKTVKFTINFCRKYNKKFIFLPKNKKIDKHFKEEINFYERNLSKSDYNFLIRSIDKNYMKENFQYLCVFRSHVTVGFISTLLSESLSKGNKILACNLSNIKILDFPIKSICTLVNCNYIRFQSRLLKILNMSNQKYFALLGNTKKNYMIYNNDKISPVLDLRNKLNSLIA